MLNFIFIVNVIVPDSLYCGKWEENSNSCVDNDLSPNVPSDTVFNIGTMTVRQ